MTKKLKRNKDILLFYKKHKWDYVENFSPRSISGFYAWYLLLVKALKQEGYVVHENDYELARNNPDYPIGIVGTPDLIPEWNLPNPAILGPSMYDNPQLNPDLMKDKRFKYYLLTCKWLYDVFKKGYGKSCKLWFAGIPTEEWIDVKHHKKDIDVLIYNKVRWGKEPIKDLFINPIIKYLEKEGKSYDILNYGSIKHEEYKEKLSRSKSMLFLCESETQGMAYQEALSSNVPVLAWDKGWWVDPVWIMFSEKPIKATSVPMFDDRCGLKFKNLEGFKKIFPKFWKNLDNFKPREFIEDKVSLSKSAKVYAKYYFSLLK